jgi:hypothetical protein
VPGSKRIPTEVLERARAVTRSVVPRPSPAVPPPPSAPRPMQRRAREKVVAALKRLHPMD